MFNIRQIAATIQSIGNAKPKPFHIPFQGGADFETPALSVPSGFIRASQNYECAVIGGYESVTGYERTDGRPAPSAGVASVIDITLTGTISVGDTVTGVTSAATGVVISRPTGKVVVTKVTGTFVSGEVLNVAATPQATTTSTARGASTALLRATYKNLAADEYRDDITVPTGSGSSLGGIRFGGVTYTWRNNAGGTAANIWKSTGSGWSQITLYNEISFTAGGATVPAEGATLTQGGVTATIKRVVATTASTTWATNTAAGRLIITNPAGGNFAAGAATCGAINFTLSGAQTAITLLPSGRYQFVVDNFAGGTNTVRIYGCDNVNRGFEFDGTVLVPISTGMTSDIPTNVAAHKNQLFFSFGSSVQHSGPGTPYIWSVILGAAEIGMGDTVTGFAAQVGNESVGALAIFTRNRTSILYGNGVANWQLVPYRQELGAYKYTIQDVGYTMFLDDPGVTSLQAAQEFGNFSHNTITARIKSWLDTRRGLVTAACVSRDKSQYRLFFSDGYALFITFNGRKIVGIMPMNFVDPVVWAWSSEDSNGSEVMLFGSTDGHVYQMEKGTSFDGDAIVSNIQLAWDFLGSPLLIKRFHDASLEVAGDGYAEFQFTYKLGYGDTTIAQPATQNETLSFAGGAWDDSGASWDDTDLVWDGLTLYPSNVDMGGEGTNLSLIIKGNSDYSVPIKFSGALVNFAPRRYAR